MDVSKIKLNLSYPQRRKRPFVKYWHHLGLWSVYSLKVAQSWFEVLTVNQTYLENDKSKFDETNGVSKLI